MPGEEYLQINGQLVPFKKILTLCQRVVSQAGENGEKIYKIAKTSA